MMNEYTDAKTDGNREFMRRQFAEAIEAYATGLALPLPNDRSEFTRNKKLKAALLGNISLCLMHLDRFEDAKKEIEQAIKMDTMYGKRDQNPKFCDRLSKINEKLGLPADENSEDKKQKANMKKASSKQKADADPDEEQKRAQKVCVIVG